MAARRRTVILCASEDGRAWDVYGTGLDGVPSAHLTQQAFTEAQAMVMSLAFGPGTHHPDIVSTNRSIAGGTYETDVLGVGVQVLLPERGTQDREFWTSVSRSVAGPRFHVSNLRAQIEETGLNPLQNVVRAPEYEVRRDWNGVTLFECLRKRQEDEAAAAKRSDAIFASMAVDRQASVRTWGINSPYWQELYGHLTISEWDTLWQGWQRQDIEAARQRDAEVARLAEEAV